MDEIEGELEINSKENSKLIKAENVGLKIGITEKSKKIWQNVEIIEKARIAKKYHNDFQKEKNAQEDRKTFGKTRNISTKSRQRVSLARCT